MRGMKQQGRADEGGASAAAGSAGAAGCALGPFSFVRGEGELFRHIMGADWLRLHPDIRRRFEKNPQPGRPLRYRGHLSELMASRAGRWLGRLMRPLIQGALIPHTQHGVPVDITVYGLPGDAAIYKQRIYHLHGRAPVRFTSHMLEGEGGEVLEYVGAGLGMTLRLLVDGDSLHFQSGHYFWRALGRRWPLPHWLTPGQTYLWHHNETPGRFNIRIEIRHPWLGTTFRQVGVFEELPEPETHA